MSKQIEAKGIILGDVERIREGISDYKIKDGIILPRVWTKCENELREWAKCVQKGVRITCDIVPRNGPLWNHDERALFIVTITNKTGYFRLEDVVVHLLYVRTQDNKAQVEREKGSPDVVRVRDIKPGGSTSTQNPEASWCEGNAQSPARRGFTLLCKRTFPGFDTVIAKALVTYKAVPYFEGRCSSKEPIIGT